MRSLFFCLTLLTISLIACQQERPPTAEPIALILTATPSPTATVTPSPTPLAEIPPLPPSVFATLPANEYQVIQQAWWWDTATSFYALYLLRDSALVLPEEAMQNAEACRLVVYHWQWRQQPHETITGQLTHSTPAPTSLRDELPVVCELIDWQQERVWPYLTIPALAPPFSAEQQKDVLGMDSLTSDVNGNGRPEFALLYQFCPNACINWGDVEAHFYEIQEDGSLARLTADLPGAIVPYYQLAHHNEPHTMLVYDLQAVSKGERFETWWIYKWDNGIYRDATATYEDDIRQWGQRHLSEIRADYGQPLDSVPTALVEILFQYEKAGLQEEAVAILLEVTDLAHWPATTFDYQCWLTLLRTTALAEAEAGLSFSLPLSALFLGDFEEYPEPCKALSGF